jgi:hypothetical protein
MLFKTYIFKEILSLTNVHFLYRWSFDFEMWTWLYRERFPLFVLRTFLTVCMSVTWTFLTNSLPFLFDNGLKTAMECSWNANGQGQWTPWNVGRSEKYSKSRLWYDKYPIDDTWRFVYIRNMTTQLDWLCLYLINWKFLYWTFLININFNVFWWLVWQIPIEFLLNCSSRKVWVWELVGDQLSFSRNQV